jgi:hypothetical protein
LTNSLPKNQQNNNYHKDMNQVMEVTNNHAVLSMLLTYEELSLTLRLVNAATLPGLRAPQSVPLTDEQFAQGLVYAERSLRARELARITPDGNFVVHAALLSAVGVCAYADQALIVQHMQPDGTVVELYGSRKDDAVVAYTLPEPGLYQLSVLENSAILANQVLQACDCMNLKTANSSSITVADDILKQARELAEQGLVSEAAALLRGGNDQTSVETVVDALAAPHSVSIWIVLERQADDTVARHELTVLRTADSAWLMTQEDAGLRTLRQTTSEELHNVLMARMEHATDFSAAS